MAEDGGRLYNSGTVADPSDISETGKAQFNDFYYQKKALIDLKKERYFGQLADVTAMPKHFGKKIKRYHYLPLLDVRNINDQGIDAAGATISTANYTVTLDALTDNAPLKESAAISTGGTATVALAVGDVVCDVNNDFYICAVAVAVGDTYVPATNVTAATDAAATTALNALVVGTPFTCQSDGTIDTTSLQVTANTVASSVTLTNSIPGTSAIQNSGNLYGSSKDIGTISGKMPTLSETGGRVNRVGFKRIEIEGTIAKFGFFDEYTEESLSFDSDPELMMHINREMLRGANEITEDALQIDLINGAGVVRYAGGSGAAPTSLATMEGVGLTAVDTCEVSYKNLADLNVTLDNNRCPKQTTIITGSRMVDTKVVRDARIMFIGSEMIESFERMTDYFGDPAFIPLVKYAEAGTPINGEIGSVNHFRIVVVPEMMKHSGAGALEGVNTLGYAVTNGRYDVFPCLVVGEQSFTTIGFQTSGKTVKFVIYHKKPGKEQATTADPFGETGFMSIKWYYGTMILRSERLAILWSLART